MRTFDFSFLASACIPAKIMNSVVSIVELRAREERRKDKFCEIFKRLEGTAKMQSVRGSNAIEGILAVDDRIKALANLKAEPRNRNERAIAGYRDTLDAVVAGFRQLEANGKDICALHKKLYSYAQDDGGAYKQADSTILDVDALGARKERFAPVTAAETPEAMDRLTEAYQKAFDSNGINKLLLIPCFILDFLCIHPFTNGNARMSRLLSLLLLFKSNFDAGRFISLEEKINASKWDYYEALRISSVKWHEGENDYFPFIEKFLAELESCYKDLDDRFAIVDVKKTNKRERVEATVLSSRRPISIVGICYLLPDVTPTTVESVIAAMVKSGKIETVGMGSNTKYIRSDLKKTLTKDSES
ncbi:MAG: Fic family protein [Clostridiales bacterium]|nr:Fic family protein [Clostridiales bacterium]